MAAGIGKDLTGMVAHHDLEALTDELIDQVLTANVRGVFATIRAFAPLLRESGDGVIVNISSGAAQSGTGSSMIYAASKAALNTMSLSLARVLGPEIRVIVVAPGMVHTGFVPGRTEEMMAKAAMATPLKRAIETEGHAPRAVREQSFLVDQLIRALYDLVTERVYPLANPTEGEKLAIVAVGGYGRGELAPYSDIDLLFLLPYKQTPHTEQVVEYLLYLLWDLGLKVGQATRSVAECLRYAKADLTIRTALLEARYIWGEQALYTELRQRFDAEIARGSAAQFVEAKLAERDARHQRVGDSRYQLEPNVKEGKGGLRDLHTLYWIAKYIYRIEDVAKLVDLGVLSAEESARFERAQTFLWTVRCHLHYLAGREIGRASCRERV